SGYLAGRAIWWPVFESTFPDWTAMRAGIERDGVPYAQQLHRLVEQTGTPWTACRAFSGGIKLEDAGPDFFARYPATPDA
ncbi:MAG TPA: tagatose-bisphosphate aldolase, partial [Lautropia sp.]|nr:tagatose-bisphosphate aldolase [Lautropia sp.]